jgi:hypothetical protein
MAKTNLVIKGTANNSTLTFSIWETGTGANETCAILDSAGNSILEIDDAKNYTFVWHAKGLGAGSPNPQNYKFQISAPKNALFHCPAIGDVPEAIDLTVLTNRLDTGVFSF